MLNPANIQQQRLLSPNNIGGGGPGMGGGGFGMPPSLELNKGMSSSYMFQSKKARRQHWYNQAKANKKLDTEVLLKGYDMRAQPHTFLLTLKGVTGISVYDPTMQNQNAQVQQAPGSYTVEYFITLFNKEIGTHGSFYGRTHRSQGVKLRDQGGVFDAAQDEYVLFHTSYTQKSSFAVIECVIVKDVGGSKTYLSGGYGICNIFEFGGVQTVELSRGSPRSIGQLGLDAVMMRAQKSPGKLTYEIIDFPAFEKLTQLIPQNCFCGLNDVIPGLNNDKLPNPRQGGNLGKVNLMLLPKATIYIHGLQLMTQIPFENRFENFLRRMKQEKMKTARGQNNYAGNDNVYISERRVIVTAHNTWKNVNEECIISMSPPDEKGIAKSGGSLTINNFICHPLIALVFRMEYKARLPSEKLEETLFFTIGWQIHLPSFNAAGELQDEQLDLEFELGPGKTPYGDLLWDPNADEMNSYKMCMSAFLSTNIQPREIPNNYINRATLKQQPSGMYQRPIIQQPEAIDPKYQQMMAEKDEKLKQFQMMLDAKEKNDRELQKQLEALEMQRLRDKQNLQGAPMNQYENEQTRQLERQVLLLQMQRDKQDRESEKMRNDFKQYMESLKEGMFQQQNQRYGGGGGYGHQPNYADYFNHLQGQPMQQSSAQQIAMIGNVFYNMLNMLGETEKDKRIIGLSDNLKKLVQQRSFDDLLAPKAPYVGMGQVNLLKTTDLPLTDQVNFIKMGMGDDLLHHPSSQLTSNAVGKEKLSLEIESHDQLRASTITFKFLCFKTPYTTDLKNIPSKLYFQFKFFTFPSFITDKVKIRNHLETEGAFELKPGLPYYLQKEVPLSKAPMTQKQMQETKAKDTLSDPNLLSITFEIDPSLSRLPKEHLALASYLYDRFLTVDVFDGDSLFLYGTCKIPLFELLRQGRGTVVRAKECEMCDPDSGDFKGALQLIMSNQGRVQSVSEEVMQKENSPIKSRSQPSQVDHNASGKKHKYKKVVKSKPMDLTKMQQTNNTQNLLATHTGGMSSTNYHQPVLSTLNQDQISQVSLQNADLRKKLRVDRVRKMTMGHVASNASVEDPSQPDWAKFKSLREIEMIRETKKDEIITRVLDEYVSGSEQLSVIPGQIEFLKIKVHNPFNQNEVFTVHVNDPDERFTPAKELQLVTDLAELRHWVAQGKCDRPNSYDVLTPQGDLILKPNDEFELLFKYITFREATPNPSQPANQNYIRPRKVQIIILQSNKQPYTTLEVNIVPSSTPIDHTFRFYESNNSHVTLQVPPFLQLSHAGLNIHLSHPTAQASIDKNSSFIKIETKTDDPNTITEMVMFIYGDQFKEKLLAACQIELYSLVTLYTKIRAGVQSTTSLSLPSENARTVMIHSNNPRLVYLPKRALNQTFRIIQHSTNHIQICAKTYLPLQQRVRIHCTDVNSGELVYQWLLVIDADQPTVTRKHEVTVKCNHSSVQQLEFANRLMKSTVYEFASSRPDLVVPKIEAITFEQRENKLVDLYFQPQPKYGTTEAYIYANDLEYDVVECYQLKITYLP